METTNQLPTQILNHLLNNEDFCRRVIPYLKPEYFDGSHKNVFDLIVQFVAKHNRLPTSKVLDLELRKVNAPEDILNNSAQLIDAIREKTDIDTEYLVLEAEKWCKEKAIYNAIMESIQIIDGMCVLPINIFNEKIFAFMWTWFVFLAIVSALGLCYRGKFFF